MRRDRADAVVGSRGAGRRSGHVPGLEIFEDDQGGCRRVAQGQLVVDELDLAEALWVVERCERDGADEGEPNYE
ncbi:hypothetical protein [Streptomyces sp. NPDC048419]|uniref:hypothetical protein n=1 Tax=Streptomyces sp. NPDC048419 TaxID=3365547 RepID=UPI0037142DBC